MAFTNKQFNYQVGDEVKTVTVEGEGDHFQVRVGDKVYQVGAWRREQGKLDLEIEGRRLQAYVAASGQRRYVALAGQTWVLEPPQQRRSGSVGHGGRGGEGNLEASMPGQVLEVLVAVGDDVSRGQTLVLLEAMKMELRLTAPHAGRVRRVLCAPGQVVEQGQRLVELE